MPSFYDNTYHSKFRKPTYDREEDKIARQHKRVEEEIYEAAAVPEPTQQMENEYMDFLQEDFKSDPWITYRFRKHMASPKRIPWKNLYKTKKEYQKTFALNWIFGFAFFWPVACMIGRRAQRFQTGVPIVPYQRYIHDFPNTDPVNASKKAFRYWAVLSSTVAGFAFAKWNTDVRVLYNPWYNRPDLKPFPAMVEMDEETKAKMHDVKMAHYADYQKQVAKEDFFKSAFMRYFLPRFADWEIRENPYRQRPHTDVYSLENPSPAFGRNNFRDHMQ